MAKRGNDTKFRILQEALNLFSKEGFNAVSIRTIADSVGIGNSALYKHFKNKREIFDSIVELQKQRYTEQFSTVNSKICKIEDVKKICLAMFKFQTSDENIVAFRRLLLLEKFKNPKIAAIYKHFFVDIPLKAQSEIFKELQQEGIMIDGDVQVFAMELYSPFYLFHFVEFNESELLPKLEKHLEYFFESHFKEPSKKAFFSNSSTQNCSSPETHSFQADDLGKY